MTNEDMDRVRKLTEKIDRFVEVQADGRVKAEANRREIRQMVETMRRIDETLRVNVLALTQAQ